MLCVVLSKIDVEIEFEVLEKVNVPIRIALFVSGSFYYLFPQPPNEED
jgi:hypothetical protein